MRSGIEVDIESGKPILKRSPFDQFIVSVPAGQTVVIDSLPLADFDALKYELSIFGPTQNDVKSLSLKVQQFSGSLKDQVFSKIGSLSVSLDTAINGSDFELRAENTEAFNVGVCLTVLTT